MGQVRQGQIGTAVLETGVIHPQFRASRSKLATSVCHTNGTDVISFRQKQFKEHLPILLELFSVGLDHHSFQRLCSAGRHQSSGPFHLHQAKPAGAHRGQSIEMAQGWQVHPVLAASLQKGRSGRSAYVLAVNIHCDD
jgi:hypothetical protein